MKRYLIILKGIILILLISQLSGSNGQILNAYGQAPAKTFPLKERNRDPFLLPAGVKLLSSEGGEKLNKKEIEKKELPSMPRTEPTSTQLPELPSSAFSLKAILISDHIRLATIDQEILSEGGVIAGERVLEIHPDRVILGKEEKRRTIYLPQSPLPLKVEEK